MSIQETIATPALSKAATATSYASAGSALAFGLNANELGVLASVIIGACTFAVGRWMEYHFRHKHYLLAEKKHELLMQQWRSVGTIDRRDGGEEDRRYEECVDCPYAPGKKKRCA